MSGTRHHRGGEALLVAEQVQNLYRTPVRPAALDDAYAVLAWTAEHAAELGIDPARIAVGGHSAGAGLAAAVALRACDQLGPGAPPLARPRPAHRARGHGLVAVGCPTTRSPSGWSSARPRPAPT